MRIESSATAITWVPSEAVSGLRRVPYALRLRRYDEPPPDPLGRLDGYRLVNDLRASVEAGEAERFEQTRRRGSMWTTVELTFRADGSSEARLTGASPFPRHWLYHDGRLVEKSAAIGAEELVVVAAESELERDLSRALMALGKDVGRRRLEPGETLVEQGAAGDELFLVLDGVLEVEVDGKRVGEMGPGSIVGEQTALEGARTATLRAATRCRLAVVDRAQISPYELSELAFGRRAGGVHRPL